MLKYKMSPNQAVEYWCSFYPTWWKMYNKVHEGLNFADMTLDQMPQVYDALYYLGGYPDNDELRDKAFETLKGMYDDDERNDIDRYFARSEAVPAQAQAGGVPVHSRRYS